MAREYSCSPLEIDQLYFFDALIYFEKAQKRREQEEKEKLMEYAMLIQITHTNEPKKLLDSINKALNGTSEDTPDLDKLRALKSR